MNRLQAIQTFKRNNKNYIRRPKITIIIFQAKKKEQNQKKLCHRVKIISVRLIITD